MKLTNFASILTAVMAALAAFLKDPLGLQAAAAEKKRKTSLQNLRDAYEGHKNTIRAHLEQKRFEDAEATLETMRSVRGSHNEIAREDEKICQGETIHIARGIVAAREEHEAAAARAERERQAAETAKQAERHASLVRLIAHHVETGHESLRIKDANVSEQTVLDLARSHADKAATAHREANELKPDSAKYADIRKLEKAIAVAQALLTKKQEREAEIRAAAEAKAAREAELAKKAEEQRQAEAKRLERKRRKAADLKVQAESALAAGYDALTQGDVAQAERLCELAGEHSREANKSFDGTCPPKMAKPLREAIETAKVEAKAKADAEAREAAAREAAKAEEQLKREEARQMRASLVEFFSAKHDANRRCAVCLAQAERLVAKLGRPDDLLKMLDETAAFLAVGYERFGVQLCDYVAGQATDAAGRQFGHRIFGRNGLKLVDDHVLDETGEIVELEKLETKMAKASSRKDFATRFSRWKENVDARLAAKQAQAKAGVKQAVDEMFAARAKRLAQAA